MNSFARRVYVHGPQRVFISYEGLLPQHMELLSFGGRHFLCLACLFVEVLFLIVRDHLVHVDIMTSRDVVWRAVLEHPVTWSARCTNRKLYPSEGRRPGAQLSSRIPAPS